jgi:sterol desaturase/sphingolipid hydroxylase (fatty acid hydroxylase superfamily)
MIRRYVKSKMLYPLVFLAAFPLYALLTFGLGVPFAFSVILTVTSLTFLLTIIEVRDGIFSYNRKTKKRWTLDTYYIVMGITASTLWAEVYVVIGSRIGGTFAFWEALRNTSRLMECLAAIVVMDFFAYWLHRLQHRSECSVLWRSHSVHHALPVLDIVAGAQVHILDGLVSAFPLLFLAASGFSHEACGAAFAMNLTSAGMHHTGLKGEPNWFNFFTVAPQTHRWHHADFSPRTFNFGFVFSVWDMLFGTFSFPAGREPARYGAKSVETFPDSVTGHILVGTTARAYRKLVKAGVEAR